MVAAILIALAVNTDWNVVAALQPGTPVQVATKKARHGGTVVRASPDSIAVSSKSGDVSLPKAEIKEVKIAAPHKRLRNGIIGVAVGAAIGFTIGWAICVYCTNEGHSGYFWQGMGIGAGIGSIGFLPTPYATVYKAPKK